MCIRDRCTGKELSYFQNTVQVEAKKEGISKPLVPIKMLRDGERFDTDRNGVIKAKVLFGDNHAYEVWPVGSTRSENGECRVPPKLVRKILDVLEVE